MADETPPVDEMHYEQLAQDALRGVIRSALERAALPEGIPGAHPAKVICFAPTLALGKKLLRSGADALVIEGMEAGGHIGPVSTSVLAQEILPELADEHLIFVAATEAPEPDLFTRGPTTRTADLMTRIY